MTNEIHGKQFRIGGVDYTVETIPMLHQRHSLFGQVTYKDTNIQVDASLSPTRTNEVVVHEILHGIFFEAGYMEQDEEMVNRLASVLHGVMRDNDFGFIREVVAE